MDLFQRRFSGISRLFTEPGLERLRRAHVCVIGSRVAQVLFPGDDPLGRHVKINHVWLTVIGILEDKNIIREEFQGFP